MGLFLETAIIPDRSLSEVKSALERLESRHRHLKTGECQFKEQNGGVNVLFHEYLAGYDQFAKALSAEIDGLILHLYIYDDDFWGYFLCEKGELLDEFNPMPDYFGDVSESERFRLSGDAALLAERFHVPRAGIERYLVPWTEEILDGEPQKAYEDDQCTIGNCWQMTWFMKKLGYPYEWE